jgi:hypothetical protein
MGMRVQRTTSNFASLAKRVFWHCIIVERVEQDAQAAFSIVNDLFQGKRYESRTYGQIGLFDLVHGPVKGLKDGSALAGDMGAIAGSCTSAVA